MPYVVSHRLRSRLLVSVLPLISPSSIHAATHSTDAYETEKCKSSIGTDSTVEAKCPGNDKSTLQQSTSDIVLSENDIKVFPEKHDIPTEIRDEIPPTVESKNSPSRSNAIPSDPKKNDITSRKMTPKTDVETPHSLTGRMCAASRHREHIRKDRLYEDRLAEKLAGSQAINQPMGEWVMVPRTRFVDDLVKKHYDRVTKNTKSDRSEKTVAQVILLGAGMDSRAYRNLGTEEAVFFEVDQQTTFDVKEPLLEGEKLTCKSRHTIGLDFAKDSKNAMKKALLNHPNFSKDIPSIWVLEGLMMYLSNNDGIELLKDIGELSSKGSALYFDGVSSAYVRDGAGPNIMGAKFIGGHHDYGSLIRTHAGFKTNLQVIDMQSLKVDRKNQCLQRITTENYNDGCHPDDMHYFFIDVEK